MVKSDPAKKAVESMENGREQSSPDKDAVPSIYTEGTTEEMISRWKEIKERGRSATKKDVIPLLPSHVTYENEKLWVNDVPDRVEGERASLTPLRKKILQLAKETDISYGSHADIARQLDTAQSYVSMTISLFDFVLESPAIYEAFIGPNFRPDDEDWLLVVEDDDVELSFPNKKAAYNALERYNSVHGKVGSIKDPEGKVVYDPSESEMETTQTPTPSRDVVETPDTASDVPSQDVEEEDTFGLAAFSKEELIEIIAALHRDNNDEMAAQLIEMI